MERFINKVALVTGAASGIGAGIVHGLALEGATVIATDLDPDQGPGNTAELPPHCYFHQLNVISEEQWDLVMDQTLKRYGKLDILVNNAGVPASGRIDDLSYDTWRRSMSVNLDGVFLGVRAGVRAMKNTGGSIINISSIAGIVGSESRSAYSAAKGGVKMLTKCAALDCAAAGWNIRVNSIHPGVIETPPVARMMSGDGEAAEKYRESMMRLHPVKRLGTISDVVNGVLYLASDQSSFVTGSELVIDGGATAH